MASETLDAVLRGMDGLRITPVGAPTGPAVMIGGGLSEPLTPEELAALSLVMVKVYPNKDVTVLTADERALYDRYNMLQRVYKRALWKQKTKQPLTKEERESLQRATEPAAAVMLRRFSAQRFATKKKEKKEKAAARRKKTKKRSKKEKAPVFGKEPATTQTHIQNRTPPFSGGAVHETMLEALNNGPEAFAAEKTLMAQLFPDMTAEQLAAFEQQDDLMLRTPVHGGEGLTTRDWSSGRQRRVLNMVHDMGGKGDEEGGASTSTLLPIADLSLLDMFAVPPTQGDGLSTPLHGHHTHPLPAFPESPPADIEHLLAFLPETERESDIREEANQLAQQRGRELPFPAEHEEGGSNAVATRREKKTTKKKAKVSEAQRYLLNPALREPILAYTRLVEATREEQLYEQSVLEDPVTMIVRQAAPPSQRDEEFARTAIREPDDKPKGKRKGKKLVPIAPAPPGQRARTEHPQGKEPPLSVISIDWTRPTHEVAALLLVPPLHSRVPKRTLEEAAAEDQRLAQERMLYHRQVTELVSRTNTLLRDDPRRLCLALRPAPSLRSAVDEIGEALKTASVTRLIELLNASLAVSGADVEPPIESGSQHVEWMKILREYPDIQRWLWVRFFEARLGLPINLNRTTDAILTAMIFWLMEVQFPYAGSDSTRQRKPDDRSYEAMRFMLKHNLGAIMRKVLERHMFVSMSGAFYGRPLLYHVIDSGNMYMLNVVLKFLKLNDLDTASANRRRFQSEFTADARHRRGVGLVHYAAQCGNLDAMKTLLEFGYKPDPKVLLDDDASESTSTYRLAMERESIDMMDLLRLNVKSANRTRYTNIRKNPFFHPGAEYKPRHYEMLLSMNVIDLDSLVAVPEFGGERMPLLHWLLQRLPVGSGGTREELAYIRAVLSRYPTWGWRVRTEPSLNTLLHVAAHNVRAIRLLSTQEYIPSYVWGVLARKRDLEGCTPLDNVLYTMEDGDGRALPESCIREIVGTMVTRWQADLDMAEDDPGNDRGRPPHIRELHAALEHRLPDDVIERMLVFNQKNVLRRLSGHPLPDGGSPVTPMELALWLGRPDTATRLFLAGSAVRPEFWRRCEGRLPEGYAQMVNRSSRFQDPWRLSLLTHPYYIMRSDVPAALPPVSEPFNAHRYASFHLRVTAVLSETQERVIGDSHSATLNDRVLRGKWDLLQDVPIQAASAMRKEQLTDATVGLPVYADVKYRLTLVGRLRGDHPVYQRLDLTNEFVWKAFAQPSAKDANWFRLVLVHLDGGFLVQLRLRSVPGRTDGAALITKMQVRFLTITELDEQRQRQRESGQTGPVLVLAPVAKQKRYRVAA